MSKLMTVYSKLKLEDASKVYIFESGNFYAIIADDAKYISPKLGLALQTLNKSVVKCGFPKTSLDKFSSKLDGHEIKYRVISSEEREVILAGVKAESLTNEVTKTDSSTDNTNPIIDHVDSVCVPAGDTNTAANLGGASEVGGSVTSQGGAVATGATNTSVSNTPATIHIPDEYEGLFNGLAAFAKDFAIWNANIKQGRVGQNATHTSQKPLPGNVEVTKSEINNLKLRDDIFEDLETKRSRIVSSSYRIDGAIVDEVLRRVMNDEVSDFTHSQLSDWVLELKRRLKGQRRK